MATRYLESDEVIAGTRFQVRVCQHIKLTRSYYLDCAKVTKSAFYMAITIARTRARTAAAAERCVREDTGAERPGRCDRCGKLTQRLWPTFLAAECGRWADFCEPCFHEERDRR